MYFWLKMFLLTLDTNPLPRPFLLYTVESRVVFVLLRYEPGPVVFSRLCGKRLVVEPKDFTGLFFITMVSYLDGMVEVTIFF